MIDIAEIEEFLDTGIIICGIVKGDTVFGGAWKCFDLDCLAYTALKLKDGIGARLDRTDGIRGFREIFVVNCVGVGYECLVQIELLFGNVVDIVIIHGTDG